MALIELNGAVAVESADIKAVVESGSDTVITLALPASTKDVTVSDMNKEQVMRKLREGS